MPVLAADSWPTNAALIRAVARLGYLREHDTVLDPTFGEGGWWKVWRPRNIVARNRAADGSDFRKLDDLTDATFDAIAYDPPYVCPGGRDTSTIKPMHERYGMNERTATDDPEFGTPAELQQMIDDGLTEMWRLVRPAETVNLHATRPNGIVLVKCKDYIWGGRLWAGTHQTLCHADDLGFECWDRFEHLSGTGPQPAFNRDGSPRPQRHARRNLTTLLVLRRPKGS